MHRSLIVALSLVLSLGAFAQEDIVESKRQALGHHKSVIRGCATEQPSETEALAMEQAAMEMAALRQTTDRGISTEALATISVYVHVITNTAGAGNISDTVIANQIRVLNDKVSAAIGAFLVGIAISGSIAERAHKLLGPSRDLFAAIFFLFFGL